MTFWVISSFSPIAFDCLTIRSCAVPLTAAISSLIILMMLTALIPSQSLPRPWKVYRDDYLMAPRSNKTTCESHQNDESGLPAEHCRLESRTNSLMWFITFIYRHMRFLDIFHRVRFSLPRSVVAETTSNPSSCRLPTLKGDIELHFANICAHSIFIVPDSSSA
jgi:hypothetical protein